MEGAKARIVSYMIKSLGIPKSNIIIVLPPVNTDSQKSVRRYELSKKAAAYFTSQNVTVAKIIIADGKSFRDDIHIKSSAAKSKK